MILIEEKLKRMLDTLFVCYHALQELARHEAFADDAPEFNMGGIGYEACEAFQELINSKLMDDMQ